MKKNVMFVLGISLIMILLTGCSSLFSHYEDRLYSEEIFGNIENNNTMVNSDTYTKQKAIEKGLLFFEAGLNKKIVRDEYLESVRLSWDQKLDSFVWEIQWQGYGGDYYSCRINSSNGELLAMSGYSSERKAVEYNKTEKVKNEYKIADEKMFNIIEPIFDAQGLDLSDYDIKIGEKPKSNGSMQVFIINDNDKTSYYSIWVNLGYMQVYEFSKIYNEQAINTDGKPDTDI